MSDCFTINSIDADTHIISEYRHCEETHCYLLNGNKRSLLIDTGNGQCYKKIGLLHAVFPCTSTHSTRTYFSVPSSLCSASVIRLLEILL